MDRGRRALPVANKHCDLRAYKKRMDIHAAKLNGIKSVIDIKAPQRRSHLRKNLKKEQLMEERFARIERENRILLEKMSFIMQQDTMDMKAESVKYSKSLNKNLRKRELAKITKENQLILRRIQTRQPTYDHLQWEEDARRNREYGENVREYKTQY